MDWLFIGLVLFLLAGTFFILPTWRWLPASCAMEVGIIVFIIGLTGALLVALDLFQALGELSFTRW